MHENQTHPETKKSFILDTLPYLVLLVLAFLLPVFFVPVNFISTQFGTSLLFSFGVIFVTIIYTIKVLVRGAFDLPKPSKYILGFTALVPAIYLLSGFANGLSRMSFFGYTFDTTTIGFILLSFLYLFLVSVFFRDKHRIFYSYLAFVVSSLVLSLFLISRIVFGPSFLSFGMFTSLTSTVLGNWNNVGIFFGIGAILSLLTHQMLSVSKIMKILLTLALISSLFFLAIVNFKIIWIILAICSGLFVLFELFSTNTVSGHGAKQGLSKVPLYSTAVLVLSLVFVFWGSSVGAYLSNKFKATNLEVRPSFAVTLDIAKNTIMQKPVFGSGPNTFTTQWLTFKPDDVLTTVFWNTDFTNGIGLIPTFAVTTGLAGILSWIMFLSFYLFFGFKSIFAKIEDPFVKYLTTSSFFISLYLWIMTFVYVPSVVIFTLTFFFTGLFFASVYLTHIVHFTKRSFSHSPKVGFVVSLVLVSFFVASLGVGYGLFKNSQSLWYFQKSFYALNTSKDPELSESYMAKAITAVPYDVYFRALSEIELVKLSNILSQDTNKVSVETIKKQFGDTLGSAIKAGLASKDADPKNYLNWVSLGKVYETVSSPRLGVSGAFESSRLAYEEAISRNPKNPGILVNLARLFAGKPDLKQARAYALQSIKLKNNYLDAYFLLSQIEVADNNLRGAIDSVTSASVINPTDPAIFFQLGLLKYNIKDFSGAIEALLKAIQIVPEYANATYFLGLSYEQIGNHQKAIEQFEKLTVTNPNNKDVTTILENLKAGKKIFTNVEDAKPEKAKNLPVKENS